MYGPGYKSSNISEDEPTEASKACVSFIQSPLVFFAILAYTIYATISAVEGVKALSYMDETFQMMKVSFLVGIGLLFLELLPFQPIIVTVGLWQMLNSGGKWGASTVRIGISTFVIGGLCSLGCLLVGLISELNSAEYVTDLLEELFLPIAFMIFAMIAISSLRGFAESVEYTALSGRACTDGVIKAGVLVATYLGFTLLFFKDVIETVKSGPFSPELRLGSEGVVGTVARLGSLLLFCISAFVFDIMILRVRRKCANAVVADAPTWQCACGQVNRDYAYTCVCGAQKPVITTQNAKTNATTPVTQPVVGQLGTQPASGQFTNEKAEQSVTPTEHIFCSECGCKCLAQSKYCKACGSKLIH